MQVKSLRTHRLMHNQGYPQVPRLLTFDTALALLLVLMLQSYMPNIVNGLIKLSTTVRAYIGLFSTIGFLRLIVQWIVHIVSNIMAHCTNFLPTLTAFSLPVTSPFICDITLHTDLISIPHDFFYYSHHAFQNSLTKT